MIQHSRLVELAIKGLEAEKARIEQELMELRKQSTSSGTTGTAAAGTRAGREATAKDERGGTEEDFAGHEEKARREEGGRVEIVKPHLVSWNSGTPPQGVR